MNQYRLGGGTGILPVRLSRLEAWTTEEEERGL